MALNRKDSRIIIDNEISNTSVNLITITEDKLENILNRHIGRLRKPQEVIGHAATFTSLLLALLTCDFKSFIGLSDDTWLAIFIVLTALSGSYLLYAIFSCIFRRSDLQSILKDIKNEH